jgi:hypothetical protein
MSGAVLPGLLAVGVCELRQSVAQRVSKSLVLDSMMESSALKGGLSARWRRSRGNAVPKSRPRKIPAPPWPGMSAAPRGFPAATSSVLRTARGTGREEPRANRKG